MEKIHHCKQCGKQFVYERVSKIFCGPTCKRKFWGLTHDQPRTSTKRISDLTREDIEKIRIARPDLITNAPKWLQKELERKQFHIDENSELL